MTSPKLNNSKQQIDFLISFTLEVEKLVRSGFYDITEDSKHKPISMRKSLEKSKNIPIITEVKFSSPSSGSIRRQQDIRAVVSLMEKGGASGISVLTQPKHFDGSLENLANARKTTRLPILMKDFIFSERQMEAGRRLGADAILLIERLFLNGRFGDLDEIIKEAHSRGMEVLLEVNSEDEYERAIKTGADMIGINNRNLGTLEMDIQTTSRILTNCGKTKKLIVSESGIFSPKEMKSLRKAGVGAFLVGASIMQSKDIEAKVRELSSVPR